VADCSYVDHHQDLPATILLIGPTIFGAPRPGVASDMRGARRAACASI
jgi:hypothetical protein